MKRNVLAVVLACSVALSCPLAAWAETVRQGFSAPQYQSQGIEPRAIRSTTQDGDTFYALRDQAAIDSWNRESGELRRVCVLPEAPLPETYALYTQLDETEKAEAEKNGITNLIYGDGSLWGLHLFTGRICRIEEGGLHWLEPALDVEELLQNCADMSLSDYTVKGFVQDTVLYFWFNLYGNTIIAFNLQTGEQTEYAVDQTIRDFVAYRERQALINTFAKDGKSLYTLQLDTGDVEPLQIEEAQFSEDQQAVEISLTGLAYDREADAIYYIASDVESGASNTLCRSANGAPFAKRCAMSGNQRISRGFASGGCWYTLWDGDDVLYSYNTEETETQVTLYIKGLFPYDNLQKFSQENPGILIRNEIDNIDDEAITLLLAGSGDVDLYAIHANQLFQAVKQKNYALDLSGSPEIADAAKTLYPKVNAVCSDGGRIYAIPSFFDFFLWRVDTQIWQDVFGDRPYPETFSELFDLMCEWETLRGDTYETANAVGLIPLPILLLEMIYQYIANAETPDEPLTFDSAAFRSTLDSFVHMMNTIDRDAFERNYFAGNAYLFSDWPVNAQEDTRIFLDGDSPERLIEPFSFQAGQPSRIRADMIVLFLNPNSAHPEEALAFLAFVAREENTSATLYYALHDTAELPVENPTYRDRADALDGQEAELSAQFQAAAESEQKDIRAKLDTLAAQKAKNEQRRWLITEDRLARYQGWMDRMRFSYHSAYISEDDSNNAFYVQAKQLCTLFCAGALSTDQLILQLNALAKKIYLENQ